MKSFKDYLFESKKTYSFKVKIAGDVTNEEETKLKSLLEKYQIVEFSKSTKTPVQALPLDFPRLSNTEVNIWDITLDYPVTSHELLNYLGNGLRINEQRIVVRNPNEPSEEYQSPGKTYDGPLLTDSTYKESPNANFDEYYGDKYNANFVKTLSDDLKEKQKARGEIRPTADSSETSNGIPQNNVSPVGSRKGK
jgi:hypothetical protein